MTAPLNIDNNSSYTPRSNGNRGPISPHCHPSSFPWYRQFSPLYLLGLFYLFLVAIIWSASSVLVQRLYEDYDLQSPFLLTYLCTSLFAVLLVLEGLTEQCCKNRRQRRPWNSTGIHHLQEGEVCRKGGVWYQSTEGHENEDEDASGDMAEENGNNSEVSNGVDIANDLSNDNGNDNDNENDEGKESLALTSPGSTSPPQSILPLGHLQHVHIALCIAPVWFISNWSYNYSLSATSIASSTVLASTGSLFTFLIAVTWGDERFQWWNFVGVSCCVLGGVCTALADATSEDNGGEDENNDASLSLSTRLMGDAAGLLSAVGYGTYTVLIRVLCSPSTATNSAGDLEVDPDSPTLPLTAQLPPDEPSSSAQTEEEEVPCHTAFTIDDDDDDDDNADNDNDNDNANNNRTIPDIAQQAIGAKESTALCDQDKHTSGTLPPSSDNHLPLANHNHHSPPTPTTSPPTNTLQTTPSMSLVFGYLGLINMLALFPLLLLLSALPETSLQLSQVFSKSALPMLGWIVCKGLVDNVLSDYLWAKSVVYTSATVATVGLGLTIPLAFVGDWFMAWHGGNDGDGSGSGSETTTATSWMSVMGALGVLVGFILVNLGGPSSTSNSP